MEILNSVGLHLIYVPTNEELELFLSNLGMNFKLEYRTELDSNPFSQLQTVKFINSPKEYVLKSVHSLLKSEVYVHQHVNDDQLTASHLLASKFDNKNDHYFLLMEKITFDHLYFFPVNNYFAYYQLIAKKLANFHLRFMKSLDKFKENGVLEYGWQHYDKIILNVGSRIEKIAEKIDDEILLGSELVNKFQKYVPSLIVVLDPIKKTKLTLVHGDFDTGNLIVKDDNQPYAIDFGLAHIDTPVIDIAHLLSATDMSIDRRRAIFETYFALTKKLYPNQVSLQDVRQAGRIMHLLFFLDWYLMTIEKEIVPVNYFIEQIHNRVSLLTELLKSSRR